MAHDGTSARWYIHIEVFRGTLLACKWVFTNRLDVCICMKNVYVQRYVGFICTNVIKHPKLDLLNIIMSM